MTPSTSTITHPPPLLPRATSSTSTRRLLYVHRSTHLPPRATTSTSSTSSTLTCRHLPICTPSATPSQATVFPSYRAGKPILVHTTPLKYLQAEPPCSRYTSLAITLSVFIRLTCLLQIAGSSLYFHTLTPLLPHDDSSTSTRRLLYFSVKHLKHLKR
jgi:hypothetical protein